MSEKTSLLDRELQALNSLGAEVPLLLDDAMSRQKLDAIVKNKQFTPTEDEQIAHWFARFITIRNSYWEIVDTANQRTGGTSSLSNDFDWHYFVVAYSAVCSLVRIDRFLLNKVAFNKVIQRKLNEPFPNYRIERKQYTAIYKSLLSPANAFRIQEAHRIFNKQVSVIEQAIVDNDALLAVFRSIPKQERYIDFSWRAYFRAWLLSRRHVWRRRGASARQKSTFAILEYGGRLVAELILPRAKKVTKQERQQLRDILQPGDIFVTRHRRALTNLFLPGFWPHAALYVGYEDDRQALGVKADAKHLRYWQGNNCTFEALKDGVRFRPLQETLNVDAFVVLRPNLSQNHIAQALARVVPHAGKGYNFDFDFFRSDQLVCTEVIYRAYDGINNIEIPLVERMGRKTLSAEDLLDLVLDTDWGEPIAIFGVGDSRKELVSGQFVSKILDKSYRAKP